MKLQATTTSRNQPWLPSLRNRVGDTVTHNGSTWSNATGKNSEPGVGTDWLETIDFKSIVKTNESLVNCKRNNGFVYGIVDRYTGEEVILKPIETIPDDIDNIIFFQIGDEYFERIRNFVKPEWFGLDGENDDIAINKAILSDNVVLFDGSKTYYTSNPIKSTKNKTLLGNFCTIESTSTTKIIQGIDELLSGSYHHDHCTITDFVLKSSTALNAINLKGFKYSNVKNINIELSDTTEDTVAVFLEHGTEPYEHCFFNQVDNFKIHMTSGGIGVLIKGVSGVSGANVNTISNGSIGGYDTYGVVIKESSVGNLIQRVDLESFEQSATEQIGFNVINSTQNTFVACHCETYRTAFKCDATSFGNRIISLSHANNVLVSEDLGENIWEFVNSSGFYAFSQGKTNEGLASGTQRIASYVNSAIRLDTTNAFPTQRNVAMVNGVGGFKFMRGNSAGVDPITDGTSIMETTDGGKVKVFNTLIIDSKYEYASNAAALGDGLTVGMVYRNTTLGGLDIVH